jgi:hypothetical protein
MKRLQTVYGWDPATRMTRQATKAIQGSNIVKVPQGSGVPGWLCLTRDTATSVPVALWVPRKTDPQPQVFRIVMDDRCFEDSILRVEYTPTHLYIADVWMWNGIKLFSRTSFAWRQTFLRQVLSCMHTPCPGFESRVVELRSDAMAGIRGYEHYTDRIGETGLFKAEAEVKAEDMYEITATDVPDVYKLEKDLGYLRVRTLELSRTLRTLGPTFRLQCVKNPENDGTWSPVMK